MKRYNGSNKGTRCFKISHQFEDYINEKTWWEESVSAFQVGRSIAEAESRKKYKYLCKGGWVVQGQVGACRGSWCFLVSCSWLNKGVLASYQLVLVNQGVGASWSVGVDQRGSTSSFYVTCKTNFAVNRKKIVVFPIWVPR